MIELNENTSVKTIRQFYKELQDELEKNEEVIVDFSKVRRMDLSVVQLILAAGRYARDGGKTLRLKSVSDHLKSQMNICGIKT